MTQPVAPFFLAILVALLCSGRLEAERPGYVTVLLYHRFDEPQYPATNIALSEFRQQLEYLRRERYQVLSMAEFRRLLDGQEPFPTKAVLITIDDPYRSTYEKAYPLLREFDFPFVLFANASPLFSRSDAYMTWEMVREMQRGGATIGNHTYYHPYIGRPQKGQDRAAYAAWVRQDLQKAQEALQMHGIETDLLAFPFGEYNPVVLEEAKKLGFELMFTQDEGGVDAATPRSLIPRVAIVGANLDMERFVFKLNLAPLHVAEVVPGVGFLEQNPPASFALRLLEKERYRPGLINMFISERSRVEATYDSPSGRFSWRPDQPLTRPANRLIITAQERDSEHFSMFSRLYFLPFEAFVKGVVEE
jgi:peptidoglycan/xylan/chitin deacetylase (PgdA/CDA1 family)